MMMIMIMIMMMMMMVMTRTTTMTMVVADGVGLLQVVESFYTHVFTAPRDSYAKPVQLSITFASGYIAGVICAIVSHPADTVSLTVDRNGQTTNDSKIDNGQTTNVCNREILSVVCAIVSHPADTVRAAGPDS
jgi:hypothetical protein